MLFRFSRLLVIGCLTLLSGCALSPSTPPQERPCGQWSAQTSRLSELDRWTVAGKVNLRTSAQNETANFDWQQHGKARYRMMISGPFGIGRNTLDQQGDKVSLTNGEGTVQAASPEELMERQLGWSLPISALYHWARALPAPEQPHHVTLDRCGYPTTLEQQGWLIEYSHWGPTPEGYWLPGRLKMHYGELTALLILKEWQPTHSEI